MGRGSIVLALALVAGASFSIAAWSDWHGPAIVAWKGSGVALLAFWAASRARTPDGWLIASVMAFGATGDVLLEVTGMMPGALAFLAGHLAAIWLYRRNGARWSAVAIAMSAIAVAAWLITRDVGIAIYALGLGAMAGAAASSRFPPTVGVGAALFVLSDLLIFARLGPLAASDVPRLLIWPAYFAGQALIVWGVVTTLVRDDYCLHHRL